MLQLAYTTEVLASIETLRIFSPDLPEALVALNATEERRAWRTPMSRQHCYACPSALELTEGDRLWPMDARSGLPLEGRDFVHEVGWLVLHRFGRSFWFCTFCGIGWDEQVARQMLRRGCQRDLYRGLMLGVARGEKWVRANYRPTEVA